MVVNLNAHTKEHIYTMSLRELNTVQLKKTHANGQNASKLRKRHQIHDMQIITTQPPLCAFCHII